MQHELHEKLKKLLKKQQKTFTELITELWGKEYYSKIMNYLHGIAPMPEDVEYKINTYINSYKGAYDYSTNKRKLHRKPHVR